MVQGSTSARMLIDCDADPSMPRPGWSLVDHSKLGRIEWNPAELKKFQPPELREGKNFTIGRVVQLLPTMSHVRAANANLLDFMLQHQDEVPTSVMKAPQGGGKISLFFPGTVYRFRSMSVIRYLFVGPDCELTWHWKPFTALLLDSEYIAMVP